MPQRKKRQDSSAFALTYILRLSSCRVMGDFVISPLVIRKKEDRVLTGRQP